MAAPKGHPRYGGRQKGTLNKNTVLAAALLDKLECNPLEGMALIAKDLKYPIELRARMFSELAQYVHPRRKAVEHSGSVTGFDALRALIQESPHDGV